MKRAITVGLIVIVLGGSGSFLIWKVQQESRRVHGKEPAEFIPSDYDPAAVVKVQPFMPPVIELVNEQQLNRQRSSVDLRKLQKNPEHGIESIMEITMEKPSRKDARKDADSGLGTESASTADAGIKEPAKKYDQEILDVLFHAEKKADASAQKVLQVGRKMSLEDGEIVQGGCWNYVDTVYNRAGCSGEQRQIVFQGGGDTEQYADKELIRPGDWLFYINHDYREARHSGIFIDWIDYEKQIGLMLSYGGAGSGEPARYKAYDLSHVYNIVRPSED
jgi:hypothetical protein